MLSRDLSVLLILLAGSVPLSSGCGQADFEDGPNTAQRASAKAQFQNEIVQVPEESLPFLTVAAVDGDQKQAAVHAPGQVVFRDGAEAAIGAPIAGRVSEIHVHIGDKVSEGDVLITLISPEAAAARTELAQAKTQLRAARTELDRQSRLLEKGVGIGRHKFEAEIRLAEAEAALAGVELAVAFLGDEQLETESSTANQVSIENPGLDAEIPHIPSATGSLVHIRAPLSGMVVDRAATLGASVEPGGEPLLSIGDPSALWLMVDVFVDDLPLVREGANVSIEFATIPHPVRGRVESVGAVLKRELRRAPVYIAIHEDEFSPSERPNELLTNAPDGDFTGESAAGRNGISLQNGMYARARIEADPLQGVVVPAPAVVIKEGKHYVVYVETAPESGQFEQREVVVGQVIDNHIQVLKGLSPGERIVVRGALLLDGTADLLQ